jgi:Leucine-rich repeat (LRR) protein
MQPASTYSIEFVFKDALLPKYYNEEEQRYDLDIDELRKRKLVWRHDDISPNDFRHIELYLDHEKEREAQCLSIDVGYARDPIRLDMLSDNTMFMQLKGFWEQETSDGLGDVDANKFCSFLQAANFLAIHGDACKRFARNMAQKGLLGTHSGDILGRMNPQLIGSEICWELLVAFAEELKCEVRVSDQVVTLCSIDLRCMDIQIGGSEIFWKPLVAFAVGLIKCKARVSDQAVTLCSTDLRYMDTQIRGSEICWELLVAFVAELKRKMRVSDPFVTLHSTGSKDYGAIPKAKPEMRELKMAPDVFCRNMDAGRHMAYFSIWFLWHLDLHRLDLTYCKMDGDDVDALSQAIYEAEGLGLQAVDVCGYDMASGRMAKLLPHLKDSLTELDVSNNGLNKADCRALAGCTKLTKLNIDHCFEYSSGSLAAILSPDLKDSLTELDASNNDLSEADCDALSKCTNLTRLRILDCLRRSHEHLVTILSLDLRKSLIELDISDNELNQMECDALALCTSLTELSVLGCFQDSPGRLAMILPYLKDSLAELNASHSKFDQEDCKALAACTKLTKLNIDRCLEDSPGYLALILPYLKDSLTELDVSWNRLDQADCDALAKCTKLARLRIVDCFKGSSGRLATILPYLKDSLTELDVSNNCLNKADCKALAACTKLTKLNIDRCLEDSPGLLAVIFSSHLKDSLTELYASKNDLNKADCRALAKCTKLARLRIVDCFKGSSGYVATILNSRLKESLTELDVSQNRLNQADTRALAGCTKLTGLSIVDCFKGHSPEYLAAILLHLKGSLIG